MRRHAGTPRDIGASDQGDDEAALAAAVARHAHDPLGHALEMFPWGDASLAGAEGPRLWQREAMLEVREHLTSLRTRHQPLRLARASGHGIGKSALVAMLIKWALDTCEDTRVLVTANTEAQVLGKTWPELLKWHRLSRTQGWFKATSNALASTRAGHDRAWRADAVTWSAGNTEAFAGLHNLGKRILLVFDEASGIDDRVWDVAQGALTDEGTEILWLAFGNPTRNTGRFREAFGRHRNLWRTEQIDSRSVEGTNKAYLEELVATYGADSDTVKVRVLGQFPSASSAQLIPADWVEAARLREVGALGTDPVVFGLDHARFGDDHSTLAIRCGRDARSRPWKRWQGADSMQIAGDVGMEAARWKPDAIFIDAGGPNAGGVIDRLRQLGVDGVFEVHFGGKAREANWGGDIRVTCANKRAEMWLNMRAWLAGGAIPDDQRLHDDLVGLEYGYAADQVTVVLEKKEHMKARGLASPDDGDALALTFAEPVQPRALPGFLDPQRYRSSGSYDRYAELDDRHSEHR